MGQAGGAFGTLYRHNIHDARYHLLPLVPAREVSFSAGVLERDDFALLPRDNVARFGVECDNSPSALDDGLYLAIAYCGWIVARRHYSRYSVDDAWCYFDGRGLWRVAADNIRQGGDYSTSAGGNKGFVCGYGNKLRRGVGLSTCGGLCRQDNATTQGFVPICGKCGVGCNGGVFVVVDEEKFCVGIG